MSATGIDMTNPTRTLILIKIRGLAFRAIALKPPRLKPKDEKNFLKNSAILDSPFAALPAEPSDRN